MMEANITNLFKYQFFIFFSENTSSTQAVTQQQFDQEDLQAWQFTHHPFKAKSATPSCLTMKLA